MILLLSIFGTPETAGDILRLEDCWKYAAKFTRVHHDKVLVGSVLTSFAANQTNECVGKCMFLKQCKSINLREIDHFCKLNSQSAAADNLKLEANKGWKVLETFDGEQNVSGLESLAYIYRGLLFGVGL